MRSRSLTFPRAALELLWELAKEICILTDATGDGDGGELIFGYWPYLADKTIEQRASCVTAVATCCESRGSNGQQQQQQQQ